MFYEDLYSNKDNNLTDIDLDSLFINTNISKLHTEEFYKFEGLLTYKKACRLLKILPRVLSVNQYSEWFCCFRTVIHGVSPILLWC